MTSDIFLIYCLEKELLCSRELPEREKSTFALNLIESALLNNPSMSALIFSLEKSSKWVLDLMARSMSEIAVWKFKPENLVGAEAVKFKKQGSL